MRSIWTDRRLIALSAVAFFGLAIQPAIAQKGGGTPSSGSSGAGSIGAGSAGTRGTPGSISNPNPGSLPNGTTTSPITPRPIFFSGKVMFDDGTQANSDIRIERVCNGIPRLETHTDTKGRFSFQLGQDPAVDTDAEDPSTGGFGRPSNSGSYSSMPGSMGMNGSTTALWNCELRAAYPGYRSDVYELAGHRSLDDPDVGTIILHRLTNVQGSTLSLTTALAPKKAQKDYQKGMQLLAKGKFEEAEKYLSEATTLYPKYAIAWFALGQVEQKEQRTPDAQKCFQAAIAADSKYVSPYDQLAFLAAEGAKWQDAVDYSNHAIQLNPVEFPSAFWYNAIANYNLKRSTDAEKSLQELLKLDTSHRYPMAESMMGALLLDKGDYPQAAVHLRNYLTLVPNAKNADAIKQVLAKIDSSSAEAKK